MGPRIQKTMGKAVKDYELELKARQHLNMFSKYHMKLHIRAFYEGYGQGQRNLQPTAFNLSMKNLDEYHISLVKYAIAKHNKEVENNAKLAFEKLTSFNTCSSVSYLEYRFFFLARNISNSEIGGCYAEVHATYPEEEIHVQDFRPSFSSEKKDGSRSSCKKGKPSNESSMGMNSNAIEGESGSLCAKGKQSHESSMGISSDSSGILFDRIPTPSLITGPPKNTGGKTLKDCELELKAMRAKYEHLNLFSKYHMKLHIKALYNGYLQIERNLEPGYYSLGTKFSLEDLNDEYHITLVKYAIVKHNKKVEHNANLALEELIYIDTLKSPPYHEYHFFFVANNLSKNDLGGYYAKVKVTHPNELVHAHKICRLRNLNEGGSGSSCEKGKQSHESSMGMNSNSIVVSDSILTPIQTEDRASRPKKTEDKSLEVCVEEYEHMQSKYDHLHMFTDSQKRSNVSALRNGYQRHGRVKHFLQTGRPITFGFFGVQSSFTLEDLNDESHTILVKYAIVKHNKEVEDNAKLAFEELIYYDTCNGRFGRDYYFVFGARKCSSGDLGGYYAGVYVHYPDMDISVKSFRCIRSQNKDENGPSCKKGKQSDESCRGMKSNANEDGTGSTCEKGKQANESSIP